MIYVFGSINVDLTFRLPHLPSVGETVLTPAFTEAVGGKGANQAIAAARDGADVSFIGCVGSDSYGHTARKALADLGIDVSGLQIAPGPTGVAAVWIDAAAETRSPLLRVPTEPSRPTHFYSEQRDRRPICSCRWRRPPAKSKLPSLLPNEDRPRSSSISPPRCLCLGQRSAKSICSSSTSTRPLRWLCTCTWRARRRP